MKRRRSPERGSAHDPPGQQQGGSHGRPASVHFNRDGYERDRLAERPFGGHRGGRGMVRSSPIHEDRHAPYSDSARSPPDRYHRPEGFQHGYGRSGDAGRGRARFEGTGRGWGGFLDSGRGRFNSERGRGYAQRGGRFDDGGRAGGMHSADARPGFRDGPRGRGRGDPHFLRGGRFSSMRGRGRDGHYMSGLGGLHPVGSPAGPVRPHTGPWPAPHGPTMAAPPPPPNMRPQLPINAARHGLLVQRQKAEVARLQRQVAQLEVSSALAGLQAYSQWQQALPQDAKAPTSDTAAQTLIRRCYVSALMQSPEAAGTCSQPATQGLASNFAQLVQDYQMRTDIRVSQYGLFTLDEVQLQMKCY